MSTEAPKTADNEHEVSMHDDDKPPDGQGKPSDSGGQEMEEERGRRDPVPWENLVERTIGGDIDARDRLTREAHKVLQRWRGDTRLSLEDCEDVCSEVILEMNQPPYKWLKTWKPRLRRRFPTYLLAKATFVARGKAKKNARWNWVYDSFLELLPARSLSSQSVRRHTFEALTLLAEQKPSHADAIWRYAIGESADETAQHYGVDRQNVYNWRSRALIFLKDELRRRMGYDDGEDPDSPSLCV